jgi:hypothetical protein
MGPVLLFAGFVLTFLVGYFLGWGAGRASGKVAAIEAAHDIDLSGNGG